MRYDFSSTFLLIVLSVTMPSKLKLSVDIKLKTVR